MILLVHTFPCADEMIGEIMLANQFVPGPKKKRKEIWDFVIVCECLPCFCSHLNASDHSAQ